MDRWQETIAENLASASVPGFKKQEVSFEAIQAGRPHVTTAPGSAVNDAVWLQTGRAATSAAPGPTPSAASTVRQECWNRPIHLWFGKWET